MGGTLLNFVAEGKWEDGLTVRVLSRMSTTTLYVS